MQASCPVCSKPLTIDLSRTAPQAAAAAAGPSSSKVAAAAAGAGSSCGARVKASSILARIDRWVCDDTPDVSIYLLLHT
jgi:hypothetical protein